MPGAIQTQAAGQHGRLHLRRLGKTYDVDGRTLQVLRDVNLVVEPGEFISIVGASGCGKSTLLRLIIGLDADYQGDILLDDRPISGTSLARGIVFQDPCLLPWLTLQDNVALALANVAMSDREKAELVRAHIELVGLTGFERAYPHQLSGGMAQRAAIARGLVTRPEILLLDEPLGALDALTRMRLQDELLRIWETEKITMILVTHDVEEAIYLGDRIVIMQATPGRISRDINVDLPPSRKRADTAFIELRQQVLADMGALSESDRAVHARLRRVS
jgi:ABC-type nitrate/sulfonate/bicarbonate transport system ATPase subunit